MPVPMHLFRFGNSHHFTMSGHSLLRIMSRGTQVGKASPFTEPETRSPAGWAPLGPLTLRKKGLVRMVEAPCTRQRRLRTSQLDIKLSKQKEQESVDYLFLYSYHRQLSSSQGMRGRDSLGGRLERWECLSLSSPRCGALSHCACRIQSNLTLALAKPTCPGKTKI